MQVPFIGSEAVASGLIRKHQLRSKFIAVFPDVYICPETELTVPNRATAAWLWSHRGAVLAGLTASALHGARYVEDLCPIELISPNRRPPRGIVTHKVELCANETTVRWGVPVTTLDRTAFDVARRGRLDDAVARLDALGNATGLEAAAVLAFAQRHKGARGMRQLIDALDLYDPGAQSPRETWLRLLLIRAGFPRPQTQIPVISADGRRRYFLDLGWEELKLAVEIAAISIVSTQCSSPTTSRVRRISTSSIGRGCGWSNATTPTMLSVECCAPTTRACTQRVNLGEFVI